MKRKYIIAFTIIAVTLMLTVALVGIMANIQLNKKENEKYYQIESVKILSLKEVCNKDLNLKNYSYSKDDNSYIKYYMYETNEGDALLNLYAEYLAIDEKFDLVSSNNSTVLEKQLEGAKCRIEMNCEEDSLELVLRYIYET